MSPSKPPLAVIVLAAGGGTRMKSATPKVLHRIGGRTLLAHAVTAARGLHPEHLVVVVRNGREQVAAELAEVAPDAVLAEQDEVPGTGRAAECGLEALPAGADGTVLVTMGDVPLLTTATLATLAEVHGAGAAATVITAELADPTGYGRILRDDTGQVVGNVEQKDATPDQQAISEINSGLYAFEAALLRRALGRVGRTNAQSERYLTDVLALIRDEGGTIATLSVDDIWQLEGVNDRVQLARLGAELNRRIVEGWMRAGVTVVDPATTWIDADVSLGTDVTIYPQTQIHGASTIGSDVSIGPDTTLTDVDIGDGACVVRTQGSLAVVGAGANVGPFAYLRPGTTLGAASKVGTFVETKNAELSAGAKVPHLSYVGDAEIGAGTNVGAGTIFANYDGAAKHHTVLGAHCKIGSNNTFVAPVRIGDGAATGAGTVVRRDVRPGDLSVSAGPQRDIDRWVLRKRAGTAAADAATKALDADATERGES
ncbi:MAG: bifunctional UDP-N-acetylglucosamine diphosphorylase/glucosamine-1-phosphate N-acetyltransferase GlmU [Nocardioidaceae bacterium]